MIKQITSIFEKREICRTVLEELPEWFGIPESREEYISQSETQDFFAAFQEEKIVGFLCLKQTGKDTVEIAVMGVLKPFQGHGIGKKLICAAKQYAAKKGFSFMQVKTVQEGHYKQYDATNQFYKAMGFKEFEVLPTLWDKWNPCQIYVMAV